MPTMPSAEPSAAPAKESSTLSVSSCRTMRPRLAPIAARMAISRRRPMARANSRLATLAQAISRTKLTAPASTSRDERTLPTMASRMGSTLKLWLACSALGICARYSAAEVLKRALAWASETPGFSRPAALK